MASSLQLPTTSTTTLISHQNDIQISNNQTLPPQQPINSTNHHNKNGNNNNNNDDINSTTKKRSLDHLHPFQNSSYFKIRSVVTELRPLLLKAILDPSLETCEARRGIQEKLELLVDQCRQQKTVSLINGNGEPKRKDLNSQKQAEQKLPPLPRVNQEKRFPTGNGNGIVKQKHENHGIPGSYIVGGSAFGWNFLMFQGTKPEYYGRTKEAFRAGV